MIRVARSALLALLASLACLGPLAAQAPAVIDAAPVTAARIEAVAARHGMVVAQEGRAARIGVEVLAQGGNTVDAAVATGFALAVTYPRAGNIGGGGYMLIHFAGGKASTAIDYRETAPAATTRDIFLDERGEADPRKSQDSALAIGVPCTVAGLALAHAKYGSGKFTLAQLIAPAIALAREGIPIENDIADSLPRSQSRLARWPATTKIFFADGRPLPPGATLLQRDLADTLSAIAREGPAGFYRGAVADKLVAAVRAAGGIMTREDLERYRPIERTPASGSYRGYRIVSMPPSSSGGVALVEMLNILEGYRLGEVDAATRVHLMVEAMKRAYFDRAKFLGDPASVTPPAYLTSKRFAESVRAHIDPARAAELRFDLCAGARGRQHHAFLGGRSLRQRGRQHHHAQPQLRPRARRRGHRHPAQQRARRLRRQAGRAQRLWSRRRRRQRAGTGQAPALIDDADHRAQGRQAISRHRLARRQPHHHHGAAGDRQRHRPQAADRGRDRRAAPPSSMVARRDHGRARVFARSHPRAQGARPRRGGGIAADLGQFDSGDVGGPSRRRRQPHPRRARRGVLDALKQADSVRVVPA